jgi:tRNA modification GTPase
LGGRFAISAERGDGMPDLVDAIRGYAEHYFAAGESGLIGRARHRELLRTTVVMLQSSIDMKDRGEELVAEELRAAAFALGRLLGRVDVEDLLDVIFRDFCIGK